MPGKLSPETGAVVAALVHSANSIGVGASSFIVGGAVRDFCLEIEGIKDVDVVVDSTLGGNAEILAVAVRHVIQRYSTCDIPVPTPDMYGVVHLGPLPEGSRYGVTDVSGQKLEIVTARREKYDKSRRHESHKPVEIAPGTIGDDLMRRDFTINTLCWSLDDLHKCGGDPENATIMDITGRGMEDLSCLVLNTPLDPEITFDEDPSRMLRGIRFAAKYKMKMPQEITAAIRKMAGELRRLPYEAVDAGFEKIMALNTSKEWALVMLKSTGLLQHVLHMVPYSRMRRQLQDITDVRSEIILCDSKFPVPISVLSEQHVNVLRFFVDKYPDTSSEAYARYVTEIRSKFLKPPFDAARYALEEGKAGREIGDAVKCAREELLFDPHVEPEELYRRVVKEMKKNG